MEAHSGLPATDPASRRARGSSGAALPDTELQAFARDGYLLREGFFERARCQRLSEAAERRAGGVYVNRLDLHRVDRDFYELITDPALLAAADRVFGGRMIPIGSIFFSCKPGNPRENGSHPHQDNYAPKAPPGAYGVIGVALDDADPGNGSLVMYPGTHRLGDLPCRESPNFVRDDSGQIIRAAPIGNPVAIPPGFAPVQLRYSCGSVIFLHGLAVHAAPRNPHPTRWRRKVYLHYIRDGAPFWPGWNARRQIMERDQSWQEYRAERAASAALLVD